MSYLVELVVLLHRNVIAVSHPQRLSLVKLFEFGVLLGDLLFAFLFICWTGKEAKR